MKGDHYCMAHHHHAVVAQHVLRNAMHTVDGQEQPSESIYWDRASLPQNPLSICCLRSVMITTESDIREHLALLLPSVLSIDKHCSRSLQQVCEEKSRNVNNVWCLGVSQ